MQWIKMIYNDLTFCVKIMVSQQKHQQWKEEYDKDVLSQNYYSYCSEYMSNEVTKGSNVSGIKLY